MCGIVIEINKIPGAQEGNFFPSRDHFAVKSVGGSDFEGKGICSFVNSIGLLPSGFIVQSLSPRLARLRLRVLVKTFSHLLFPALKLRSVELSRQDSSYLEPS